MRHRLDARNLLCPLPVIRVQSKVSGLAPGDELEVTATDPGVRSDVPAWCRVHGHEVVGVEEREGDIVITLRVGGERVDGGSGDRRG